MGENPMTESTVYMRKWEKTKEAGVEKVGVMT